MPLVKMRCACTTRGRFYCLNTSLGRYPKTPQFQSYRDVDPDEVIPTVMRLAPKREYPWLVIARTNFRNQWATENKVWMDTVELTRVWEVSQGPPQVTYSLDDALVIFAAYARMLRPPRKTK